ncbi:MAG TPA: zinc-ribbon domain-containing protein [Myxococcales bacterium]|jgi:predicted Zn finger-like uncharacterized protein|nr:zinc-ribbon domain-containing protein [Myxococcales bacterium]
MEVRCDKCQARYRVDDARIGPQGLTMRCGKCQNTFKVTRPAAGAPAPAPAAAKPPAPRPPPPGELPTPGGATEMLYIPPKPAAAKPPAVASKPVPARPTAPAKPAAPADEGAGRTMMFQTGNVKSPAAKPQPQMEPEKGMATLVQAAPPKHFETKPPPTEDAEAGSTMVFAPPTASPKAAPKIPSKPAPTPMPGASDDVAGATMMFGTAPLAKDANTPATAVRPPTADDPGPPVSAEPGAESGDEPAAQSAAPEEAEAPDAGRPEGTQESTPVDTEAPEAAGPAGGRFDKAPPKGLLIGVAAGLAVLVLALLGVVAFKKMGSRPPPQAAIDSMNAALGDADKDTLASLASAESKARDALDEAGPKAKFPDGAATFARIEVQLADAYNDQAARLTELSGKETDEKKKADDDAKAADLTKQADAKLKSALDTAGAALKKSTDSTNLILALCDYYRAKRSPTNLTKFIKAAQAYKADEAQIAFIQGAMIAQQEEGFEAAVQPLKQAIIGMPTSARVHYRLALVYLAMKDEAAASAELKTTLQISPQHERAKATLDGMTAGPK